MTGNKVAVSCRLLIFFLWATFYALDVSSQEFNATANISSNRTNNASKSEGNKQSETQNVYSFDVNFLDADQESFEFNLDYRYSDYSFSRDSQEDSSLIEGGSLLRLGKASGLFNVSFSQSQRRTLIDKSGLNTTNNSDERSIVGIEPELNLRLSGVDVLSYRASGRKIEYEDEFFKNSEHVGHTLSWNHLLSKTSSAGINLSSSEISYVNFEDLTYDYQSAAFFYQSSLRHFSYNINIGHNKSSQNGKSFESPAYDLTIKYEKFDNSLTFSVSEKITDTSSGDENTALFREESIAEIDSSANTVDQFKLTQAGVDYRTGNLCLKCDLILSFGYKKEKYQTATINDVKDTFWRLNLNYSLSDQQQFSIRYGEVESKFDQTTDQDFTEKSFRFSFRQTLFRDLDLNFHADRVSRDSEIQQNYSENIYGIVASYHFR